MAFFAHTDSAHPRPAEAERYGEPLFTPFGDTEEACRGRHCEKCRTLDPRHGHLNKVAAIYLNNRSSRPAMASGWSAVIGLRKEPIDERSPKLPKKKAGYSVEHCPLNLIIATKRTTSSDQLPGSDFCYYREMVKRKILLNE